MNYYIKRIVSHLFVSVMFIVLFSGSVFAETTGPIQPGAPANPNGSTISVKIDNPFKGGSSLLDVITKVLENIVMPLATVFVVLAIIYAGFKYVMAQGNSGEIKKANEGLVAVLIGTAILLGATAISAALKGTICSVFASACA